MCVSAGDETRSVLATDKIPGKADHGHNNTDSANMTQRRLLDSCQLQRLETAVKCSVRRLIRPDTRWRSLSLDPLSVTPW